ncbi:PorV/PorQ family protein [Candidatus Zixiibacteriota bacterium]
MRMWKLFIVLVITILCVSSGFSQTGLSTLKISNGANPAGMASAVSSFNERPDYTAYNPASAVGIDKFTASFGHTSYWENVNLESVYFGKHLKGKTYFHGGIRFASIDNLELRSFIPTADPTGQFDANDLSFKTGIAYMFSEKLTFGVAMGWFIEKIEAWRGSAFNVDFGLLYKYDDKINIGASAVNIGSDFQLSKTGEGKSDEIPLPKTYRFGLSYKYQKYTGALDLVHVDDKAHLHIGAEGKIHPMFTIRSGYMLNYDSKNFTAGVSFIKRNIEIDYAFVPFSNELGTAHIFNFSFSL